MRSVESSKVGKAGQDLVGWILDHAVGGIGKWSSASDLADEYKRKPYRSDAERVQAVIRSAVAKNAATGFATGLGGVLTLPVAIPTSLAASLAIQARMVAAIAEIHGHDSKDDQVQTAILLCMLGTAMEDVVKQAGVTLGGKVAISGRPVPTILRIRISIRSEASEPSCSSNPSWQPQPRSPRSSASRSSPWWTRRSRDGRGSTAPLTAMLRSGAPISNVSRRCGGEPFSGKAIGRSWNRGSRGADSRRRSSLSVQSDDGAPES